jgi:hypothetical protein
MTFADLRKQLELDLEWRQKEMRLLYNMLSNIDDEEERRSYCKALVVMLYSHFEGFCKLAFSIYIDIINEENMRCSQVNVNLAAISLEDIFQGVNDPNKNCGFFKGSPPNDRWKRFFRRAYFLANMENLLDEPIKLTDEYIKTYSNLKIPILDRTLYHLGFQPGSFDEYTGEVSNLVDRRNDYAHGEMKPGIKKEEYEQFETITFKIMSDLMGLLDESLKNKRYLRLQGIL